MRKIILVIGSVLVLLNTIAGLIFQNYEINRVLFSDLSLICSLIIYFFLNKINISDGFKIGLTLVYIFTGIIRFFLAITANNYFENNYSLFVFIGIIGLECIALYISKQLTNK
jgi:hypothetical protein